MKSLKIMYADGDVCLLQNLKINSIINVEREIANKAQDSVPTDAN